MSAKIIIASLVIVVALVFGAISFVKTNVEYTDFQTAIATQKRVQVKGEWMRQSPSDFNRDKYQFSFFMKDDNDRQMKVILDGAKPNNFESANAVVVKGRYENGVFHATECLTKCPSKYEVPAAKKGDPGV